MEINVIALFKAKLASVVIAWPSTAYSKRSRTAAPTRMQRQRPPPSRQTGAKEANATSFLGR
jgi:hypothetical protein